MVAPPPPVHEFRGLPQLLSAWLAWRRVSAPGYSYRDFAREVGERNLTILHAVIKGTRRVTPAMMARWQVHLAEREPDRALLMAMAVADDALATLQRKRAWAIRRQAADAEAQRALALARWREANDEVERLRAAAMGREIALSGPRGGLASVGLSGPPHHPDHLLRWLQDSQAALLSPPPPGGLQRAVHGLTEATGPKLRFGILAALEDLRDALLALDHGGPLRFHAQVALFPLSLLVPPEGDTVGPLAPTPATPRADAPEVYAWGLPGDDGVPGYLAAWLAWRKAEEPGYSLADFATETDQPDRTLLWKLIHRRQRLTPMRALQLARGDESARHPGMGLTEDEGRYLALLAQRDASRGAERERIQRLLDQERSMSRATRIPPSRAQGWADPLPWTLLELCQLASFRRDPTWCAAALWPDRPAGLVARTLDDLEALGLDRVIEREFTAKHGDLLQSPVTRYHQAMKARAVEVFSPDAPPAPGPLAAFALTIGVSPGLLPELHAKIEAFARGLQRQCAGSHEPRDQVMQVNVHGWAL